MCQIWISMLLHSINIHKIQVRSSMFELPDDLIAESHFREVAIINLKGLIVVATIEVFV